MAFGVLLPGTTPNAPRLAKMRGRTERYPRVVLSGKVGMAQPKLGFLLVPATTPSLPDGRNYDNDVCDLNRCLFGYISPNWNLSQRNA